MNFYPIRLFSISFFVFILIFIFTNVPSSGQIPDELLFESKSGLVEEVLCSQKAKYEHNRIMSGFATEIDKRPYDVLSYDLYLDWRNPLASSGTGQKDRSYVGINKIVVVATRDDLSQLEFDSEESVINEVKVNSAVVSGVNHTDGILTIDLPQPATSRD